METAKKDAVPFQLKFLSEQTHIQFMSSIPWYTQYNWLTICSLTYFLPHPSLSPWFHFTCKSMPDLSHHQ